MKMEILTDRKHFILITSTFHGMAAWTLAVVEVNQTTGSILKQLILRYRVDLPQVHTIATSQSLKLSRRNFGKKLSYYLFVWRCLKGVGCWEIWTWYWSWASFLFHFLSDQADRVSSCKIYFRGKALLRLEKFHCSFQPSVFHTLQIFSYIYSYF